MARKPRRTLTRSEVSIIKAMIDTGNFNDQEILSYFTRPSRTINHRAISEIRNGDKHGGVQPCSEADLSTFLKEWPDTILLIESSQIYERLLIKARESMVSAVFNFNSAGLRFRSEIFIVVSVIAWTYLLHAWYGKNNIDYRYKRNGEVIKTKFGADMYWELSKCISINECPLQSGVKNNLEYIIEVRNEIEHKGVYDIDQLISAKLQACCLNFEEEICRLFGNYYSISSKMSLSLQFASLSMGSFKKPLEHPSLPPNIEALNQCFIDTLSNEEANDPKFSYRVLVVPLTANRLSQADTVHNFVKAGSDEAKEIENVYFKEVHKKTFLASKIVNKMKELGYRKFSMHDHTMLWKELDAKNPNKGLGKPGLYKNSWEWFEPWLDRVQAHCEENAERYT